METGKQNKKVIVLLVVILIIAISIFGSTLTDFIDSVQYSLSGGSTSSRAVLDGEPTIVYLGKTYKDNATSGYSYYAIDLPVYNNGRYEMGTDYEVPVQLVAEDWEDVDSFYETDDSDFAYSYEDVIPSGTTGIARKIYLIKDGVDQVKVICYETSDDYYDEKNGVEFNLKVPTEEMKTQE